MQTKLDILVSSKCWKSHIGNAFSYNGMFDIVFNELHNGDPRTIAFWIGKECKTWVKDPSTEWADEKRNQWRWKNKMQITWKDGFLQRHGYLETIYTSDSGIRMFKILKGID